MDTLWGHRTRDASSVVTLDTTVTAVRSVKMLTVTGNGSYNQYFSIPEITASSFVVVDSLYDNIGGWSPQAFWSDGTLHLRSAGTKTWQLMILSQGGGSFSGTGSYGIRSRNNNLLTQIDSVNRILTVRYGGAFEFGMYWRPGMRAIVSPPFSFTFPEPITTYERPMVFLNAEDYMMVSGFYVRGSPGNWTGWGISHLSGFFREHGLAVSDYMKMKWFLATYQEAPAPQGAYGELVRSESGQAIFSSANNLALLNNQPSHNAFYSDGGDISGSNYNNSSARMPWTESYADYVLANALFSHTNIEQTQNPIIINWGGFLPGNRSILKMYAQNYVQSPATGISANGRTLFASRPMKPI